eukprot:scaffold140725_cov36-Tisochrysis_lutea.AAC.4
MRGSADVAAAAGACQGSETPHLSRALSLSLPSSLPLPSLFFPFSLPSLSLLSAAPPSPTV